MNRDTRRTRLVLGTLLVISFVLITVDVRGGDSSPLQVLRTAGATVFGPFQRAASAVVSPVAGVFRNIGEFGDQKKDIKRLQDENERLRRDLNTSELDRNRAAELDKMLRVAGLGQYKIVPAQVIAYGAKQGFSWTVTVDAGSRDGLRRDQTVVNGDGLVGRVTTVGDSTSTVLLATDPSSAVGARLAASMKLGIVSGHGREPMTLQLLDAQATMRPGDRLVTFGSQGGRPFVPGVPFGQIDKVEQTPGALTRSATVRPFVDFTALDVVGVVVQPPRKDPRDAVLPPIPAPTPTGGSAGRAGQPSQPPTSTPTGPGG
jgi:rod shape-determining protein MreC